MSVLGKLIGKGRSVLPRRFLIDMTVNRALAVDVEIGEEFFENRDGLDAFDNDDAWYVIAFDKSDEAHLGSVRLVPTMWPTCCATPSPISWTLERPSQAPNIWELSRLCAATNRRVDSGRERSINLVAGELLDAAVDVARLSPIGAEALLGVRGPTRSGRGDHAYNLRLTLTLIMRLRGDQWRSFLCQLARGLHDAIIPVRQGSVRTAIMSSISGATVSIRPKEWAQVSWIGTIQYVTVAAIGAMSVVPVPEAVAQEQPNAQFRPVQMITGSAQQITLTMGKGALFKTSAPYAKLSVGDEKIVEVIPQSDHEFVFTPKGLGINKCLCF